MNITCHGAARVVTGSCHQVQLEGTNFLIDCGLFQGGKGLNRLNYEEFHFNPEEIDFVIVTHGHIDHCGLLPKLVKKGFKGEIYTTDATADLLPIMLGDAAYIQEKDTEHENRRRQRLGQKPRDPLYTRDDAEKIPPLLRQLPYGESMKINDEVTIRFRDAGHVIGSAIVELFLTEKGNETKVVFSGDLGQWDVPIIEDPSFIWNADYVFMESTYGDRLHGKRKPRKELLFEQIMNTYKRGGKLLIPSFALERTQELLYLLSELKTERPDFPDINIYLDSPLAIKITKVFRDHPELYDEEARSRTDKPFDFPGLTCTTTAAESMRINASEDPAIVIAGSGMCTAGRIRHHLKHGIWDPKNTVLFVGYQAPGTLGRILLDGASEVRMMGLTLAVKAEIVRISSFSAHADRDDLVRWLEAFKEKPKKVFLVHGEGKTIDKFSEYLDGRGFNTAIPTRGNNVMA
ncbi:MAG: MBL fold metallo-hydrolase [Spirochaetaceae bacterium]|nr:MBL fold metallo-hydrolase [Spirochaetaceae bacterium]